MSCQKKTFLRLIIIRTSLATFSYFVLHHMKNAENCFHHKMKHITMLLTMTHAHKPIKTIVLSYFYMDKIHILFIWSSSMCCSTAWRLFVMYCYTNIFDCWCRKFKGLGTLIAVGCHVFFLFSLVLGNDSHWGGKWYIVILWEDMWSIIFNCLRYLSQTLNFLHLNN